jgi:hypothetical protein
MECIMELLFDLPLVFVGPAMLVVLMAIALGGLALFRRHVLPRLQFDESGLFFSGSMLSSIMVFYGLAMALIAVNVWETYKEVEKITTREATSLATLYRDASEYPEPARTILCNGIRAYVEEIIQVAWPLQHQGKTPLAGVSYVDRIQVNLMSFEPTTDAQRILAGQTVAAYNVMVDARRIRVDSAHWHLPGVMWMVIMLGAVIGLVSTFFFPLADARIHGSLVALLALFIGAVMFMVLALDRPYRGDLGVPSTPYEIIYNQLMTR